MKNFQLWIQCAGERSSQSWIAFVLFMIIVYHYHAINPFALGLALVLLWVNFIGELRSVHRLYKERKRRAEEAVDLR